uniref:Wee1-like protein kinase n=1 Tax=Diabrotica virgifera virgifera TaxID=50390 RepID=A0A6P7H8Q7_DIAVI
MFKDPGEKKTGAVLKRSFKKAEPPKKAATPAYGLKPVSLEPHYNTPYYRKDYTELKYAGTGCFGSVVHVIDNFTELKYAVKKTRFPLNCSYWNHETENNRKVGFGFHPNILKFYKSWKESTEIESMVYMVIEPCQITLSKFATDKKDALKEAVLWDCLLDIGNALQYLHKRSLVHYDVKEDNIMLFRKSFKLGDFGCTYDLEETENLEYLDEISPVPSD